MKRDQTALAGGAVGFGGEASIFAKLGTCGVVSYVSSVFQKAAGFGGVREGKPLTAASLRDWNQLVQKLAAQRPWLNQISSDLEKTFILVGSGLEELVKGSDRLLTRCEALRQLQAGGEHHYDLEQVLQLFNAPLRFLAECESELRELTVKLRKADHQIGSVLSFGASVRRTLAPLSYMQVLFRSESAKLPLEMQEMFITLSNEIQQLHDKLQSIFDVRLDAVRQTRGTVLQGISKLEDIIGEHKRTTNLRRLKVQQMLDALREELDRHQHRDLGVAEASQKISNQVGQIVVGLQSQDIISQRLNHVLADLSQLIERYSAVQNKASREEFGQFAFYASKVSRLEVEQLEGIVQEAERAERTIQTGLQCILQSVNDITQSCLPADDAPGAVEVSSPTAQLATLVEALAEPLAETRRRTATVCDMTASLGSLASDLTGIFNEVAGSIWLTGLNAQVQSAQSAHGTGLGIISAQTSSIACETKSVVSAVVSQIEILGINFREIVSKLNGIRDKAAAHQATLTSGGSQQQQQLSELNRQMLTNGTEIHSFADDIRKTVMKVQAAGRFGSSLSNAVAATKQTLGQLGGMAEAQATQLNCASLSAAMLDDHKIKYTMATEVAAFNKVMAAQRKTETTEHSTGATPTPQLSRETGVSLATDSANPVVSLGNNVELF